MLDSAPEFGTIQGNIKNRYNEIEGEGILTVIHNAETLDDTMTFSTNMLEPVAYVDMDSGTHLLNTPFLSREDAQQGAVESSSFFAIGVDRAFKRLHQRLPPHRGGANYVATP